MAYKGSKRNKTKHWEKYQKFRTVFESACERANLHDVTPARTHGYVRQSACYEGQGSADGSRVLRVEVSQYGSDIRASQPGSQTAGSRTPGENSPPVITPPAGELSELESSKILVVNKMGR